MIWAWLLACSEPEAPSPPPVPPRVEVPLSVEMPTYTLSFPDAAQHRVHVRAEAPSGCGEWWMPTWIPGSYLVREFARNVTGLRADGPSGPLPVQKVAKNRWKVDCDAGPVVVSYQLYANELSVRTNHVDADGAVLNPAALVLVPPDHEGPMALRLLTDLDGPYTALSERAPGELVAPDLDTLIDSPILLGDSVERSFAVEGVKHTLVTRGGGTLWDHDRATADVQRIVEVQRRMWGAFPYDDYVFLNAALGGRGGLEHDESTLVLADPWATRDDDAYTSWLGIMSHELFHAWNVKALRPKMLGPFDYENEVYTRELWIAEGFTSYYDDLFLLRAGLIDEQQWLEAMSDNLRRVQGDPGHLVMPLADASFDAWIEYYRRDADSPNQAVSYYLKGAVVAWLLDTEIRRATDGRRSLDDVLRAAWPRFAEAGYDQGAFRALISEVAGTDLEPWLVRHVDRAEPIELDEALAWWGLVAEDDGGGPWLGLRTRTEGQRVFVDSVLQGGPGWHAGVNPDDELLALDGWRIDAGHDRLRGVAAGSVLPLVVARRGQVRQLTIAVGESPPQVSLRIDPDATLAAGRRRDAWGASGL
jgi:predicted metalloprotease with PDZ domain